MSVYVRTSDGKELTLDTNSCSVARQAIPQITRCETTPFAPGHMIQAQGMRDGPTPASAIDVGSAVNRQVAMNTMAQLSLGGILKGIGKGVTGIIPGTIDDRIFDTLTGKGRQTTQSFTPDPGFGPGPCPSGTFRVRDRCVAPGDAFPGGDPLTFAAGGQMQAGAFGVLATTPTMESVTVHRCPPGLVLGKDNLCYDKRTISNSQRKNPRPPRPAVSAADMKAIRKAAAAQKRVKSLAGKVGFSCKKR
ncbi:MAG TPA: hypothetical protein DG761_07510 [Gammaproteobacteria bacterium]|nr:hypothetical protein [Gammaproteobacteria bacterium]